MIEKYCMSCTIGTVGTIATIGTIGTVGTIGTIGTIGRRLGPDGVKEISWSVIPLSSQTYK